jgi:glutaminyl-tRNA synthetase
VALTKRVFIEREDFRETAPRKWFRFAPGKEVRLRYACLVRCVGFDKDQGGRIVRLRCTWDPDSRGGTSPDGRKVKGTSHFVSAEHSAPARVHIYDRLFTAADPDESGDWKAMLNPESVRVVEGVRVESYLKEARPGQRFQFERLGYFCVDARDEAPAPDELVFNRTIALRDSWAKLEKQLASGTGTG